MQQCLILRALEATTQITLSEQHNDVYVHACGLASGDWSNMYLNCQLNM